MTTSLAVPFIDIKRFEPGLLEEFFSTVQQMVRNTEFIGGPQVTNFEKEMAVEVGHKYAVGCANGTDAIQLALRAAGVGAGDTVLIPDMTFWATFEAVVNAGASPATIDVDPGTLHLSAEMFARGIEKFKPKAAILVHLYGWAAPDTERIRDLARTHNVRLIEDAAQAIYTLKQNRSVIGGAWLATTSFYPAKVLGASGDAGAVFTSDESLAKKVSKLLNHGRKDHYSYDMVGWNSRMGAYEAAYMRLALKHMGARLESRRRTCKIYRDELKNLPIVPQTPAADVTENGYLAVAMMEPAARTKLITQLQKAEIGFGTVYPGAMSEQEGARGTLAGSISNGNAARIASSVLNLPCFAYIKDEEIARVIEVVRTACKSL